MTRTRHRSLHELVARGETAHGQGQVERRANDHGEASPRTQTEHADVSGKCGPLPRGSITERKATVANTDRSVNTEYGAESTSNYNATTAATAK